MGNMQGSVPTQAEGVMGNTYSSTKPSLPALNLTKVKQTPDNPDDLYIGNSHPQRNVVSLSSARLPGTARKLPPTQQLINIQDGAGAPGMDHQSSNRLVANNIVPKPQVPALNLSKHDGYIPHMGSDQSLTARVSGQAPGSLPHVQRGSHTSRPAYGAAAGVQQYNDTIRAQPAVETGPITPAQALKRYGEYLTAYEQSEILQYTHIWFLGKADVQKIKGNPHLQKTNFGYDDDRGDYHVTPRDHIAYRYEVQSILGKGSFGQVLKVLDYKTGSYKALKIIRNKKRFHHQAQVELKVLEHLRANDPEDAHHVIHIQEHFMFRNHLCITFELLSINLYEFIKQNNFAGLSLQLIKRFAAQMLVSLKFLRRHKLIHCDLKPENVLLVAPQRSGIKVIDFGSSCFVDERMYTYVQSRFYRSPEVILGLPYGCEIDMWSFGCILAELFMGYPLFPGEDETEQLLCIMEIMGLPPSYLVDSASRRNVFFDSNGNPTIVPNSRGKIRQPGAKSLWSVLRCQDANFVDLLEKCLRWDPSERITPEQAMTHPWMQDQITSNPNTYRQATRSRQDQQQAPTSGKLQPTSVIAAAAAALGAGGAIGKAAARAVGIPLNTGSNSSALCSSELNDQSLPAQQNYTLGTPAAAAVVNGIATTNWQSAQVDACLNIAQAERIASDTSQSKIDCTPRQVSITAATAAQGSLSAAAPVITAGSGTAGARFSTSSNTGYTPRAMETDAPGIAGKGYASSSGIVVKQQVVSVLASGSGQQSQVVVQQQRSGGRDVTGPDQAALMAASNILQMQASMAAAAATASNTAPSYMASDALGQKAHFNASQQTEFMRRQQAALQYQLQPQQPAWPEQAVALNEQQQLELSTISATNKAALSSGGSVNQQLMLLQQQILHHQELGAGMAVIGQGIGHAGNSHNGTGR